MKVPCGCLAVALVMILSDCYRSSQNRHGARPLDKIGAGSLREHYRMAFRGDLPDRIATCTALAIRVERKEQLPRALTAPDVRILQRRGDVITASGLDAAHWRALSLDPSVVRVEEAVACAGSADPAIAKPGAH